MITVDCTVEAGEWPHEASCRVIAERAVLAAVKPVENQFPDEIEVSLLFTNDHRIGALNAQWRDQDKPTNVLSFAANEGGGPPTRMLGDIVLAQETITREADEQGKTFEEHLTHLIVHGFLHLVGFDHVKDAEAETMEQLERQICAKLGIADPYAEH